MHINAAEPHNCEQLNSQVKVAPVEVSASPLYHFAVVWCRLENKFFQRTYQSPPASGILHCISTYTWTGESPISLCSHNRVDCFFHEGFSVCAKATTESKYTIPKAIAWMWERRTAFILLTNSDDRFQTSASLEDTFMSASFSVHKEYRERSCASNYHIALKVPIRSFVSCKFLKKYLKEIQLQQGG